MSKIKTAIEFAKNIKTVGAFKQTSPRLEREICKQLTVDRPLRVIEFGMGHGNITKAILKRINAKSSLYSFEINEDFCLHVANKLNDSRLNIINDSAEHVMQHVNKPVDFIITSLPFSFFSKEVSRKILTDSRDILMSGGCYSQILYAVWAGRKLKRVFDRVETVTIPNIPPEHVFHCWKK